MHPDETSGSSPDTPITPEPEKFDPRAAFDAALKGNGITLGNKAPAGGDKAPEAPTGDDEAARKGDQEGTDAGGKNPDLDSARAALKRYGMSDAVLGKLSEAEVLDLGKHQAKIQADNDALRAKGTPPKGEAKKPEGEPEPDHAADEDAFALPEDVTEELGPAAEPLARSISAHVKAAVTRATQAVQDNLRPTVEKVKTLETLLEHELLMQARQRLSAKVPEILDDAEFGKVVERMRVLEKSGTKYRTFDAMMEEAAVGALGADMRRRLTDQDSHAARTRGQPRPPGRQADGRFASADDKSRAAFDGILAKRGIRQ